MAWTSTLASEQQAQSYNRGQVREKHVETTLETKRDIYAIILNLQYA